MKKIIAFIKQVFGVTKALSTTDKKEVEQIATNVVKALDEVKKKTEKKNVATSPAAVGGGLKPLEEAPKAPKKKKKYYKPKQPKA